MNSITLTSIIVPSRILTPIPSQNLLPINIYISNTIALETMSIQNNSKTPLIFHYVQQHLILTYYLKLEIFNLVEIHRPTLTPKYFFHRCIKNPNNNKKETIFLD